MKADAEVIRKERGEPRVRAEKLLRSIAAQHPEAPHSAMIEIADRCNEVCVHCYQVQGQKGEMTTEEIFKILDDLAAMGVLRLNITGGEATLRGDLIAILRRARELSFLINLYTNGLTMTRELAAQLGELGLHAVEISLYSRSAEKHDFVTGVPGSFDKTVAGIRYLRAENVFVVVKTPLMSVNDDDIEGYTAFVEELGAFPQLTAGDLHGREDGETSHWALNPRPEIVGIRKPSAVGVSAARPRRDPGAVPCGAGQHVHVEPNGEMRPCTQLQLDLGDARTDALSNRSHNEALQGLAALGWGDIHGCRDCAINGYCIHCYAHALDEVGDALAPYASACKQGRARFARERGVDSDSLADLPAVGPYDFAPNGRLRPAAHVVTAEDESRVEAMPWIRRQGFVAHSGPASAQPGDLVQLRRPGRKAGTVHKVPVSVSPPADYAGPGE